MNIHRNARTTPHSQLLMVRRTLDEQQPQQGRRDFGVSERTVRKWLARWRAGGERPQRRSSAPRAARLHPNASRDRGAAAAEVELAAIAALGLPLSTSARSCALGLGRSRSSIARPVGATTQEPGELIHVDTKKLGRMPVSATVSPAGAPAWSTATAALAGNTCTSPSMTPRTRLHRDPAGRTQGQRDRLPRARTGLVRAPRRHRRADHDRQRQCLPQPRFPQLLRSARLRHLRTKPIGHEPTARRSASSRPSCANALMPVRSDRHRSGRRRCRAGSTSTTFTDRMPPSLDSHPSVGSP